VKYEYVWEILLKWEDPEVVDSDYTEKFNLIAPTAEVAQANAIDLIQEAYTKDHEPGCECTPRIISTRLICKLGWLSAKQHES